MDHPLRNARLFEVGETEGPAGIGGIDHVTDAERQRLSPYHYLVANKGGQRTGFVLPPRIAELVGIVVAIHIMAEASVVGGCCAILRIIRTIERIRRFVCEPSAREERVVLVQAVVPIDLKQRARLRKVVAALCVSHQVSWVLPHAKGLAAVTRDV